MVMRLDAKLADTPAGKPFAPDTPLLLIPVAPVVVWVMFVSAVLIHAVDDEDAALAVLAVIVNVAVPFAVHPAGLAVAV